MTTYVFSDNAVSSLASGVSGGATSLTLTTGEGVKFPTPAGGTVFTLRLGTDASNEVVTVSARSTDALTCSATANAWPGGTQAILTFPAVVATNFVQRAAASSTDNALVRWDNSGGNSIQNSTATLSDLGGLTINGDLQVRGDTEANLLFADVSADTVYLGGTTNGVSIAKGGVVSLLGTASFPQQVALNVIAATLFGAI
jgi:hypothetical protein